MGVKVELFLVLFSCFPWRVVHQHSGIALLADPDNRNQYLGALQLDIDIHDVKDLRLSAAV